MNLKKTILYFDGKPIQNEKKEDVLVCDLLARALFEVAGSNVPISPEEKYRCWKISQRILAKPEATELESEDIVLIKKIIAPSLSAGVYGQIVDLLESNK